MNPAELFHKLCKHELPCVFVCNVRVCNIVYVEGCVCVFVCSVKDWTLWFGNINDNVKYLCINMVYLLYSQ